MTELFNCWKTKIAPLIGIFILSGICPLEGEASGLKDIRIGEYDQYTRVVFEFDGSAKLLSPPLMTGNTISLVFDDASGVNDAITSTEFKKPVQRMDITSAENRISVNIVFSFNDFTFDTFFLSSPPRFVVDVFHNSPAVQQTPTGSEDTIVENTASKTHIIKDADGMDSHPIEKTGSDAAQGKNKSAANEIPMVETKPVVADKTPIRIAQTQDKNKSTANEIPMVETKPVVADKTPIRIAQTQDKNKSTANEIPMVETKPAVADKTPIRIKESPAKPTRTMEKKGDPVDRYRTGLESALYATSVMIVVLCIFLLYQKAKNKNAGKNKTADSLPNVKDQRIKSIDVMIKENLKLYEDV